MLFHSCSVCFCFFYFMFGDLNLIHMYETHGIFLLSLFVLIMYSMCYSMTINLIWIELNWKSQPEYFAERCDGGPKYQHFWPTTKPFINSTYHVQENIILPEKDDIVNDAKSVAKILTSISKELPLTSDLTVPFLMTMVKMRFWYL